MCTESTYSYISRMIALRKQTGQYTNDLVSMHTNASTIPRRLCGLKVPLRQSFAQRLREMYIEQLQLRHENT